MDSKLAPLIYGAFLIFYVGIHESAKIPSRFEVLKASVKNADLRCNRCEGKKCDEPLETYRCLDMPEDDMIIDIEDYNLTNAEYACGSVSKGSNGTEKYRFCTITNVDDKDACDIIQEIAKYFDGNRKWNCSLCSTNLCNL